MITQARIDADLEPAGFDWITALRAPTISPVRSREARLTLCLKLAFGSKESMNAHARGC